MSKISQDIVQHVALLSRLRFSSQQVPQITHDLNRMLEYVEKLNELDTSSVPPTSHSIPMSNVMREDTPRGSLPADDALQNAPEKEGGCFKVPKILP
jgi:aspartyl-tRNA(Asn)/glutamyl-tRNA(Gln) amidotransferase subunit C